jgi:cytochrome c oxidase subunit I+III
MSESRTVRRSPIRLHKELSAVWNTRPGLGQLAAVNHTVLGKRFMATAFVFFAIGGLLAMLIRVQLATSASSFVDQSTYSQLFTMHGTIMMFLFAIPMFEGMAIYLLPKMLGARDMAFPRLTAYGFWCYVFGGTILIVAMLASVAPDGGWFMYTPLTSSTYSPGINADIWLLGVTFVEISALSAAVEITVTVLKLRAPGMSIERMPIMAWYLLVTALMMLLAFPPLILGSILLEVERAFGLPFFDPTRGGDALLWQHLFWLFGHPEVYIIFLPAAGAISTMVPTFARHELVGYRAIVVAIIALGFLSFGLWVHHMFTVGIPHLALGFFSAASALIAIPTAVQIFAWIATFAQGRPKFDVPMFYLGGFFAIFLVGGLTGVMLAIVPFNFQVHDTHFVVAHFHYVLIGGFVFPMLAAAYYWLSHVTGRISNHRLSVVAFWLIFVGFNLTFLVMHVTGLLGMPRRIAFYPAEAQWDWINLVSSVGSFVMSIGFALFVVDLFVQVRFGTAFRRNPWGARTLEWAMPTPPPSYAFASLPSIDERADRLDPETLGVSAARGDGYLGHVRNGWMETLGVDITSAEIEQVVILPGPTFLPLWAGLATAGFVLGLLFKMYWVALLMLAVTVGFFCLWTRSIGTRVDLGLLPIGRGETAPPHWETARPPSWWAMILTLLANSVFFASLLFGAVFLCVIAPAWPLPVVAKPEIGPVAAVAIALGIAFWQGRVSVTRVLRDSSPVVTLLACACAHLASVGFLLFVAIGIDDPTSQATSAVMVAILCYALFHSALGAIFAAHGIWRYKTGYISKLRSLDLRICALWHSYTAIAGVIALLAVFAVPALAGLPRGG